MNKIKKIILRIVELVYLRYSGINFFQVFRYGVVGCVNTTIEYSIFVIAYYLIKQSIFISNSFALVGAIINGFLMHHRITFRNNFYSTKQMIRYALVVGFGVVLNYSLLITLIQVFERVYVAKLIQIIILSFYNYNMYKFFVYINKEQ